jgi:hypothetical protein
LDRSGKFGGFEERDEYTFYKQGFRMEQDYFRVEKLSVCHGYLGGFSVSR